MTLSAVFSRRTVAGATLAQAVALVPPNVVVAAERWDAYWVHLGVVLCVAMFWEALFAGVRGRGFSFHGITTALVIVVFTPPELAAWQLAFAASLGVVLGEAVFGGRGFGFLSPATLTLTMIVMSFPQMHLAANGAPLAMAVVPGGVLLLALGLISWRIILAAGFMVVLLTLLGNQEADLLGLAAALAFGMVFLLCDPVSSAATNAGRWVFGGLAGVLIVVFSPAGGPTAEAVVFASLMASVFAPLIDHLVVLAHAWRRKARHV